MNLEGRSLSIFNSSSFDLLWNTAKRVAIFILGFILLDLTTSLILETGLKRFYGLGSDSRILMNGSSMTMSGIDPDLAEMELGQSIAFYAKQGVGVIEREIMI